MGRHKKVDKYDKMISFRTTSSQIEEFKKYTPNYQKTIRDLIDYYIDKCKGVKNIETNLRYGYYKEEESYDEYNSLDNFE